MGRDRNLNPENELLWSLMRESLGGQALEDCKDVLRKRSIDWPAFERVLLEHRVLSLVFDGLVLLEKDGLLNKLFWDNCVNLNRTLQMRQLRKANELVEIAREFEKKSIRYLTLKGPALSQWLFEDVAKRHCGDLDFLVLNGDFQRAVAVLISLGYTREKEAFDSRVAQGESIEQLSYHSHFDRSGSQVELHWRLSSNDQLFTDGIEVLYARRASVEIAGLDVPILAPDDLVDYLTVHGSSHCWHRLKWLHDIAQASKKHSLKSGQPALHRAVSWRQRLLHTVYRELPTESKASPHSDVMSRFLTKLSITQIAGARRGPDSPIAVLGRSLSVFLCTVGIKKKFDYVYRLFSWDQLYARFPLPRKLRFFYCVVGPFYWVWRKIF